MSMAATITGGRVTDVAALTRMQPFLVLAPHPDDETLGCGGLLARTARLGIEAQVVVLTDGARSHDAPGWPAERLATLRAQEVKNALGALGIAPGRLHLMQEADGGLAPSHSLVASVTSIARAARAATVFVTDPADSHPDHRAAFRLAVKLVELGAVKGLVTYPVSQCFEGGDLTRFDQLTVVGEIDAKRTALAAHQSQTGGIMPAGSGFHLGSKALEPFLNGFERFRAVHGLPGCLPPDDPAHFDRLFAADPDPWRYDVSAYEQGRHSATVALLTGRRFRRGWEAGTAAGALAEKLLTFCDELVATDASSNAVAHARKRLRDRAKVSCMKLPDEVPEGRFDLILLSDMLYYLGIEGVIATAQICSERLHPGGLLVLVSWLGETEASLTGEESAEAFLACAGPELQVTRQERHRGFRLDVMERRAS